MTNDIETVPAPSPIAEGLKVINEGLATDKTPEQISAEALAAVQKADADAKAAAKKALADKIAARVVELKTFEGKTFARNDGTGLPTKVVKYAGILTDAKGGSYYAFTVEIPGHARWNPSATDFLNEYHVIEVAAETEINSEPK
jgi:hypothetical protein